MLFVLRALALYLLLQALATWVGTCDPCANGQHGNCKGSSRNPCDCAKNGHR